jgi:hypothetical protein
MWWLMVRIRSRRVDSGLVGQRYSVIVQALQFQAALGSCGYGYVSIYQCYRRLVTGCLFLRRRTR